MGRGLNFFCIAQFFFKQGIEGLIWPPDYTPATCHVLKEYRNISIELKSLEMHKSHVNNFKTSQNEEISLLWRNSENLFPRSSCHSDDKENYESEKSFEDEICSMQSKEKLLHIIKFFDAKIRKKIKFASHMNKMMIKEQEIAELCKYVFCIYNQVGAVRNVLY